MFERICELCKARQTNLTQLEKACGFANATVRRWVSASPTVENLVKVADYFEVSTDYLLGRGIYEMSSDAVKYARQFEELTDEKKQLAMAYMGVVKAQV